MRCPLVIGNWKLNGNYHTITKLVTNIRKSVIDVSNCKIVIAPPEVYLDLTKRIASGSQIILGAQNIDVHLFGAFTGETSAKMLKDIGVQYVIIGHSERRLYHKESDILIAEKFSILKEQGLVPILCIGETEQENQEGKTEEVCANKISTILETQGVEAFENAVIAYEPIWAIGSGRSAVPELVQKIHKFIRNYIAQYSQTVAKKVVIQYGGSVNVFNAEKLFSYPDIDGALIGNASLQADSFSKIVKIAAKLKYANN